MNHEGPDRRVEPGDGLDAAAPRAPEEPSPPVPRRRFPVRLMLLGLPLVLLLLVGWNRAASSDTFCASCHQMEPSAISADRSVHRDVPCIACHAGSGLAGAVTYVPTLVREGVHMATGWGADGVLDARACSDCHAELSPAAHQDLRTGCTECHGDPSHPQLSLPGGEAMLVDGERHPEGFIQTHGKSVEEQPSSCVECHESRFCEACHLRETFPHPDQWIAKHGDVQVAEQDSCTLCHGPTFCAGCHGTEIPHRDDWLGRHDSALEEASTTPCMTCHPETDCTVCHSEHAVHIEQDLYTGPPVAIAGPSASPSSTESP